MRDPETLHARARAGGNKSAAQCDTPHMLCKGHGFTFAKAALLIFLYRDEM